MTIFRHFLTADEYEKIAEQTAVIYCCIGLGSEAGELQGKMKKVLRGDTTLLDQREAVLDEAGDVLSPTN